ncbi:hypothetical protein Hanom_Chr00s000003g01605951 [Helianthus anomalus]
MVYMVCQNKARGEEAVSKIQSSTSNQTKCSLGGTVFGFFFIFMVPTHRKESTLALSLEWIIRCKQCCYFRT